MNDKIMQQNVIRVAIILVIIGVIITVMSFALASWDITKFYIEGPQPWYRAINWGSR